MIVPEQCSRTGHARVAAKSWLLEGTHTASARIVTVWSRGNAIDVEIVDYHKG